MFKQPPMRTRRHALRFSVAAVAVAVLAAGAAAEHSGSDATDESNGAPRPETPSVSQDPSDPGLTAPDATPGATPATPGTTPTPGATPSDTPTVKSGGKSGGSGTGGSSGSSSGGSGKSSGGSGSSGSKGGSSGSGSGTAPSGPAGRPNSATTGVPAGVSLTSKSGGLTVTKDGTVVDSMDISGGVVIKAKNVVIRNSKIHGNKSGTGVNVASGSVSIVDSEIYDFSNGITFNNWSATRVDIHGMTDDGVKLGSNVVLEDSWIHALTPSGGAHADGGQIQSGVSNVVVRNNIIDVSGASANSALFMAPDLGPSTSGPVTVSGNILNGGNYALFCVDGNNGEYFIGNITIANNRFGRGSNYGAARVNVPVAWSGNVWDDNGSAVNP